MKAFYKLLVMLLVVSMLATSLASCDINSMLGKGDSSSDTDADDNNGGNNDADGDNNTDTGNNDANTDNGNTDNGNTDDENTDNGNGDNADEGNTDNGGDNTDEEEDKTDEPALSPFVDYASTLKFNPNSGRNYIETTVKTYVDGDTTHFNVPKTISSTGVLKARYLGVNTPESTGQIEEWGKMASRFTKTKLQSATSIIVESNDDKWNPDSTGDRYLVWVWYKTADMTDYKNLNVELLQSGLSRASSFSDTCYADICLKVFNQAVEHKLYVFSNEKDDEFYYGDAVTVTLKDLKLNVTDYANTRVAFEGVVVREYDNTTIYVEEYDEETGVYFGMQVYYGYNLNFFGKDILKVGNRVRIAGSLQYYETGGTWQVCDIKYDPYDPESADNIKKIETGHTAAYPEMDVDTLLNGKLTFEETKVDEDGNETVKETVLDYGYVVLHSTAIFKNLTIKSVYTTKEGDSKGAMTITCQDANGNKFTIRTIVLVDSATQNQVTADFFPVGSNIDVRGIVDFYDGTYQLKLLSIKDVTFN